MHHAIRLTSHPRSELRETLQQLPVLLDRYVGLIRSIEWYKLRPQDPQFYHCHAYLPDLSRLTNRVASRVAGGTALTKPRAQVKAIGEAIERYCGTIYDEKSIKLARRRDLSDAVDPRRFLLFHPAQYQQPNFPFCEVDDDSLIGWVAGYSLTRDKTVALPATMVHPHYALSGANNLFELGSVSGYACGNTIEEAILGGICEVIERDAFMINWYNKLPASAIEFASFTSMELAQVLDRYRVAPVQLYCRNITSDIGIPTVLALMLSQQPGWPAAVIATAADLSLERATIKALLELAANHLFVRGMFEHHNFQTPEHPARIEKEADHGLYYCHPARLSGLAHIFNTRAITRAADLVNELSDDIRVNIELCLARLAKLDLEVFVVDLTTADIAELGFKVVKVIIPGMQPIDFGMQWQHLGGPRLRTAPPRMGYQAAQYLNLTPHPFP